MFKLPEVFGWTGYTVKHNEEGKNSLPQITANDVNHSNAYRIIPDIQRQKKHCHRISQYAVMGDYECLSLSIVDNECFIQLILCS